MPQLEAQLKKAEKTPSAQARPKLLRTQVGAEEIAEVVSRANGIPVSKMMQGERDKLLAMEDKLHQRVVARTRRCSSWPDAIRRSRAGLSDPNRPYGSSFSSAPPAWARPSCARRSPPFCSIRGPPHPVECRNSWRSTRSRA